MKSTEELDLPKILYKYRGYEGRYIEKNYQAKTILNYELFVSSPKNFNDPFDLSLPYVFTDESLDLNSFIDLYFSHLSFEELKSRSREDLLYDATHNFNFMKYSPKEFWESKSELISNLDHSFYGVLSLAKKNDNILMWSHYADFHKGYCIGFDTISLMKFLCDKYSDNGFKIGPVKYQSKYPQIDFNKQQEVETSFIRCFTKHLCWEYESEYRIVFHNFVDEVISYPKEIVKEIYLGCKMSESHCDEVLNFIKIENLKHVKVYKMNMGYSSFCVEAIEVNI